MDPPSGRGDRSQPRSIRGDSTASPRADDRVARSRQKQQQQRQPQGAACLDQRTPRASHHRSQKANAEAGQPPIRFKGQARPARLEAGDGGGQDGSHGGGGEGAGGGHPEPLPQFKDQARPAGFEADEGGDGAGPEPLPHFKDQARSAGFDADDGGEDGEVWSSIAWAQSVRELSEDNNTNNPPDQNSLPTLPAVVLQIPSTAAADNAAPMSAIDISNNNNSHSTAMPSTVTIGGENTQQIVLRKHMIWAGSFLLAVLGIAVVTAVAVVMSKSNESRGSDLVSSPSTTNPLPTVPPPTNPPVEKSTKAPVTHQPSDNPTREPVIQQPTADGGKGVDTIWILLRAIADGFGGFLATATVLVGILTYNKHKSNRTPRRASLEQQQGDCCNNDSTSEGQQFAAGNDVECQDTNGTLGHPVGLAGRSMATGTDGADSTASVASITFDHALQFLGLGGGAVPFGKYWLRFGASEVSNNWSSDNNNDDSCTRIPKLSTADPLTQTANHRECLYL